MSRQIELRFTNGKRYSVDCCEIAHDFAGYYSGKGDDYEQTFQQIMDDETSLYDWLANDMDWYMMKSVKFLGYDVCDDESLYEIDTYNFI